MIVIFCCCLLIIIILLLKTMNNNDNYWIFISKQYDISKTSDNKLIIGYDNEFE